MDLIIQNNANLFPRDQIQIERLEVAPYPDGRRVKVIVQITPFRERPNLDIAVFDADGSRVASSSVIGAMAFKLELNLHLRGDTAPEGTFSVRVKLYFDDIDAPQDARQAQFHIEPSASGDE
jgi:hypothetical protein